MVTETDIEKAIIEILKADSSLYPFTMENTVWAMSPATYPVMNSAVGAILVSVSYENFQLSDFQKALVNREWRVTVALGVRNLRSNEKLWEHKSTLMGLLAFTKPLAEMGKLIPVTSQPFSEQVEGIFWIRMEFSIKNYLGVG